MSPARAGLIECFDRASLFEQSCRRGVLQRRPRSALGRGRSAARSFRQIFRGL